VTRVGGQIRRRVAAFATVSAALAVGAALATPSGASPTAGVAPVPLATSIQSSAGTWATLPMGDLGQPLNTFWQLFYRPAGTTSWSNEVEATATATNGGLILSAAPGQPFIAGVRPAGLLHFSPLIATTDGGHSWTDGVVPKGLAASPDSLSTTFSGSTLALVDGGLKAQVLMSTGALSAWHSVTTAGRLAASAAGKVCGLRNLVALATESGEAVVGASCSHAGVVGIFTVRGGVDRLVPLHLPAPLRAGRVQVLGLEATASGLSALLAVTGKSGTALAVARTTAGGSWAVSSAQTLSPGTRLDSFGPTAGVGFFALVTTASGRSSLAVDDDGAAGAAWQQMPTPPRGTDTVAFDPSSTGSIDALAVHDSTVTVWTLATPAGSWVSGQVLHVKIRFGSSS
jgi:hypothetical protein